MTGLRNLPLLLGRDDRELAVVVAVVVILLKDGTNAAYVRGCVCAGIAKSTSNGGWGGTTEAGRLPDHLQDLAIEPLFSRRKHWV